MAGNLKCNDVANKADFDSAIAVQAAEVTEAHIIYASFTSALCICDISWLGIWHV